MARYIKEHEVVVRIRSYVEAGNLDEAIVKGYYMETSDREFLFGDPVDDVTDDFRIRREDSEEDDWTVARQRAQEQGYHVDTNISAEDLAVKIYRIARVLGGTKLQRIESALGSLIYAHGVPQDLRLLAARLAGDMIDRENGGGQGS